MNRRADAVTIALAIIYTVWGSAIVGGILLTPKHIVNKANERCIAYGGTADVCKAQVDAMTQAERKAYIRDTVEHPQPCDFEGGSRPPKLDMPLGG